MARSKVKLDGKLRVATLMSFANIMRFFPASAVSAVLRQTGKGSRRERDLPAGVTLYYVIALCLFSKVSCEEVLRSLVEALRWISPGSLLLKLPSKGAISMARSRLGSAPLKELYASLARPVAKPGTKGACYKTWRLTSMDGTAFDLQDTGENSRHFGRPPASRGESAFPQLRAVALSECGTHILYGAELAGVNTSEVALARMVVKKLLKGDLCLADRGFFSYTMWTDALATGADLLWRAKTGLTLVPLEGLPDGSFLVKIHPDRTAKRNDRGGVIVRVIEYKLKGLKGGEGKYRLLTSILDYAKAPAAELAALYMERWEIETAFDELKTHLLEGDARLRSKTPELVLQEVYGLLMAHFAVRAIMHEAAIKADEDPDRLSFVHSVRVLRRRIKSAPAGAFSP